MKQHFLASFLFLLGINSISAQTCNLVNEGFENTSAPTNWQMNGAYLGTSPTPTHTGSGMAGLNTLNDNIVIKPLNCPGEVCFWWRASGSTSNFDISLDWSEDNGANWTTEQTIALTGTGSSTTYQQVCVNLPENSFATGKDILLRLNMPRRVSGTCYVDDFCVSQGICAFNLDYNYGFSCAAINEPISFTVCAQDVAGTKDNTFNGNITISKASGAGNLAGTLTQTAVNGCATFTDISLDAVGNYTLNATDGSRSVVSKTISVNPTCAFNSLKVMSYNLLNFPNGSNICGGGNIMIPNRQDTLRDIINYIQPDALMVCELQTAAGAALILNNSLNTNGVTRYKAANFVANTSPGGTGLNNMFYYNSEKLSFYTQTVIPTDVRDISLYTVFVNDPNLAVHKDTIFLDFYVTHLKAGRTATDTVSRNAEVQALADFVATRPNRNAFFGGDFNLYSSTDIAYNTIVNTTFDDPTGQRGNWESNPAFAALHTQTTRAAGVDMDCGATGGMDSRLDFIFASDVAMTGTKNITYRANSYEAVGNDGTRYNSALIRAANVVPRPILFSLYYMSDHLPIVLDLDIAFPTVLPIDLARFTATYNAPKVDIEWATATETAVKTFVVEHSTNTHTFASIGSCAPKNKQGASYTMPHHTPAKGINYYRLATHNNDGSIDYSPTATVKIENSQEILLFPNPTQHSLQLNFQAQQQGNANLFIYNLLGKIIYQECIKTETGTNTVSLDHCLPLLPAATYILQVRTDTFAQQAIFTKQ